MQNILRATDLLKIIDGTFFYPSNTIRSILGIEIVNPEAIHWNMIDAHLLSCITATLSRSIFTYVLYLQTNSQTLSRYCKKYNTAGSVLLKSMKFFETTKSFT
ncbi:hypothetical protein CsSME_00022266 [Camellia sinensis var. sinensis]